LAPEVVAIAIELRNEDVARAGAHELGAAEAERRMKPADEHDVVVRIDRSHGLLRGGAAESLAPQHRAQTEREPVASLALERAAPLDGRRMDRAAHLSCADACGDSRRARAQQPRAARLAGSRRVFIHLVVAIVVLVVAYLGDWTDLPLARAPRV